MNPRAHCGPDASGAVRHDVSTCAHPLGPCPGAWQAVQAADARYDPDAHSTAARQRLPTRHGVSPERVLVLVAASSCGFIQRIASATLALSSGPVIVPAHAYGDCTAAACARGRPVVAATGDARFQRWTPNQAPARTGVPPRWHEAAPSRDALRQALEALG